MNTSFSDRWYGVAEKFAPQEAIVHIDQRITYRELAAKANAYAHQLTDLALGNTCIPILVANPVEHIAALLGVLLSGNYYYSINPERAPTINQIVDSVGATALIATADLVALDRLPDSVVLIQADQRLPRPVQSVKVPIEPTTSFCLFTTSGSTGEPKQVIHAHQSVLLDTNRQILSNQIGPADRIDLLFSLEFSASLACLFPALLMGATLVVHDLKKEGVFALPTVWQRERISFSTLSVSTFRTLLKSSFDFKMLDRLRFVSIGAEPVYQADIEAFQQRFGPQTVLQIAYATTETRTISEHKIYTSTNWDASLNSVGKPVSGRAVRIRAETGSWLAPGEVGEIVVLAKAIPAAYANAPVLSQSVYQVQADGQVQYATGDVGYLDEAGYLYWRGRTDFMLKKNGQKINLLVVEEVLRRGPGIAEAAVVGDSSTPAQPLVRAFLRPNASINLPDVKRWVADQLPAFMLPDRYQSVAEFPRTRTGKVDRLGLLRQYPIDLKVDSDWVASPDAPDDSLLAHIKRVWAQELRYSAPIGDYDDFFRDLGGNSLRAETCLASLEAHLGQPLPMHLAFAYPTPHALASFLTTPTDTGVQCISLNPPVANRPHVYFIPPLSGDKRIYQWLEEGLGNQANLYCLYFSPFTASGQLRALPELCDSLAQLVDVSAPSLLIGYSFGGMLAYEIALRVDLLSAGHQQNRLVLIDTPLYKRYPFAQVIGRDLKRSWHKLQRVFRASESIRWSINVRQVLTRYLGRLTTSIPLLPPTDWQQKAEFAAQSYSQQVIVKSPVRRPILLFRASDPSFFGRDIKPDYRWQDYTKAGLEEHSLLTNHYHILNQINSKQITHVLERILAVAS